MYTFSVLVTIFVLMLIYLLYATQFIKVIKTRTFTSVQSTELIQILLILCLLNSVCMCTYVALYTFITGVEPYNPHHYQSSKLFCCHEALSCAVLCVLESIPTNTYDQNIVSWITWSITSLYACATETNTVSFVSICPQF